MKRNLTKLDLEINTHIFTIDGLFAGFAFAGVIQIITMDKTGWLLMTSACLMVMATLLFALRINIAVRIISCLHSCVPESSPSESPTYTKLGKLGQKLELLAIIAFWSSLIPASFHYDIFLGYFTASVIVIGFIAYFKVISMWKQINRDIPQL